MAAMGGLLTLLAVTILHWVGRIGQVDAAAVAAYCGSVSVKLLLGALVIGALAGSEGLEPVMPLFLIFSKEFSRFSCSK